MPCNDGDYGASYAEKQKERELQKKVTLLQERNNQLMRVICKIDTFLEGYGIELPALCKDAEVKAVIQEHRITDEDRWFNSYSVKYPQFSKDDISKLVKAGLLEDI